MYDLLLYKLHESKTYVRRIFYFISYVTQYYTSYYLLRYIKNVLFMYLHYNLNHECQINNDRHNNNLKEMVICINAHVIALPEMVIAFV